MININPYPLCGNPILTMQCKSCLLKSDGQPQEFIEETIWTNPVIDKNICKSVVIFGGNSDTYNIKDKDHRRKKKNNKISSKRRKM